MDVGYLTCICSIQTSKGDRTAMKGGFPLLALCRLKLVDIIAFRTSGSSLSVSRIELFLCNGRVSIRRRV